MAGDDNCSVLSLDLETYSDVDLTKCGVFRYVEGDFHILMLAYAFDDEEVQIVDMACGEPIPQPVLDALDDPGVKKAAWNAQFERTCLSQYLGRKLEPDSWFCTMAHAASLSLPLALKNAAAVLKTGEQKDKAGEALIRYFSVPCKPTKANGGRTRNLPEHDPEGWAKFKEYCRQDVRTERDIRKKIERFPLVDAEWNFYHMDQRINDRGVMIDTELVEKAIECDLLLSDAMTKRAYELTGLENPNSVSQLKSWLNERGVEIGTLGKKDVAAMIRNLEKGSLDSEALEMLKLRLQMAKSSVKKYQAAERCTCKDGRARGLFQFSGANRTQRWCLAEGTPVLVRTAEGAIYEKPIEDVLLSDAVYDGCEWVHHEGVFYSGEKDVITWDGITATEDHMVYVDESTEITLVDAKRMRRRIWRGNVIHGGIQAAVTADGAVEGAAEDDHEKMRTYDIINAGPHNRFMANGRVVSNSGRNIQLQNLVRNEINTLDEARELVKMGEIEMVETIYGNAPDILSQLCRTMLVPKPGCEFIVADFSAIEARVLAWEAGEQWRLEAFVNGEDIYCASASQMFGVPVVKHGVNGELRQRGKVAELACGYGGSVGALKSMGALDMGVKEEELQGLIDDWRSANPNIVQYWWGVERAALQALGDKEEHRVGRISFRKDRGVLWMKLPSGRGLAYMVPKKEPNKFGRMSLTYMGVNAANKWDRLETYSGKLVENATQAIARDILAEAMWRMEQAGLPIVAHVHDEVILEVPVGSITVDEVCEIMSQNPAWAEGLPLAAAGYLAPKYYFKD